VHVNYHYAQKGVSVLIWINEAGYRRIMTSAPRLALLVPWDARPLSSQVRQLNLGLCILSMIFFARRVFYRNWLRGAKLHSNCNKV
jgi:hypothetical protein